MISILTTLFVGLIVGFIARALKPGDDKLGWIMTALLGVAGSFLASYAGVALGLYKQGDVAEHDATLAQIVGRELQRHIVSRNDADVVFAHFPAGVGDKLVPVFQRNAKAGVGQHLVDLAAHLNQFFFSHKCQ